MCFKRSRTDGRGTELTPIHAFWGGSGPKLRF
jgi:hypothetical protein